MYMAGVRIVAITNACYAAVQYACSRGVERVCWPPLGATCHGRSISKTQPHIHQAAFDRCNSEAHTLSKIRDAVLHDALPPGTVSRHVQLRSPTYFIYEIEAMSTSLRRPIDSHGTRRSRFSARGAPKQCCMRNPTALKPVLRKDALLPTYQTFSATAVIETRS